jgi:hypothetical protein
MEAGQYFTPQTIVSPHGFVVLRVRRPESVPQSKIIAELIFIDPDLADVVAKAITHAVELCGGGAKELF